MSLVELWGSSSLRKRMASAKALGQAGLGTLLHRVARVAGDSWGRRSLRTVMPIIGKQNPYVVLQVQRDGIIS